MKFPQLILLSTVLLAGIGYLAGAQGSDKTEMINKLLSKYDTNTDSQLSINEFDVMISDFEEQKVKARLSVFDKLDSNGDGRISENEFTASARITKEARESRFDQLDENYSGKLDRNELSGAIVEASNPRNVR